MFREPTEIRPLVTDAEAEICARMMSCSEPWLTLGRDYAASLGLLRDERRERYVAWKSEQIAGFLVLNMAGAFVGYIQIVCVAEDQRGKGLGTRLLKFAEDRILRDSPNVFICVSDFNVAARRLYERLGYLEVGELSDYLVAGHAEILLRKSIGPITGARAASTEGRKK